MAFSEYSEVMLLGSLQQYLLAQRILFSLILLLKISFVFHPEYRMYLMLLLYAGWSISGQLHWSLKQQLLCLVKLVSVLQQE